VTAAAFRRVRVRLGLSQSRLAAILGIAPNSVARLERGERAIPEPTARLILLVGALASKGDGFEAVLAKAKRMRP
jgi:transcriptional regulator with XRE-family HTH domain